MPVSKNDNHKDEKIIGYSVIDNKFGNLGEITYINTQTKQKLIYVKKDTKEFCFPMHDEFIKEVMHNKKALHIEISEELLNLN
jgi:16S rRNA processing protein RimM